MQHGQPNAVLRPGQDVFHMAVKRTPDATGSSENPGLTLTAESRLIRPTGVDSFKNLNLILVKSALKMRFKYILCMYKNIYDYTKYIQIYVTIPINRYTTLSHAVVMQSLFLKKLLFINPKLIAKESLKPMLQTQCSHQEDTIHCRYKPDYKILGHILTISIFIKQ